MAGYPDYTPPNDAADPGVIADAVNDYLTANPPGIPDHNDTTLRDAAGAHPATAITVDAAGFNGNLTTTDDTVQEVAQKLDDLTAAGIGAAATSHSHAASAITSGTLDDARIPNLAASKITSGSFDAARLPANVKGYVNHGSTASTARPTGYASIEWYGTVEPTNAVEGDTWNDPT